MELNKVYCMDCLEGIKRIGRPDLILTDPPYDMNITKDMGFKRVGRGEVKMYNRILDVGTDTFDFNAFIPPLLDLQGDAVNAYFFCNKKLIPRYLNEALKRGLSFDILGMRKRNPIPAKASSYAPDLEYVIFLRSPTAYFDGTKPLDYYRKVYSVNIGNYNEHPNQKPVEWLRRMVEVSCPPGGVVLDPFAGSGSSLVAAAMTGRKCVGFEKLEQYAKISNRRLSEVKSQTKLFDYVEVREDEHERGSLGSYP